MAKEKAVNYTETQVATLRAMYTGADNAGEVKAIAEATGKAPASVRAKLAQLKIYVSDKATGDKSDRVTKEAIVDQIGKIVGLPEQDCEGLVKATKSALEKILAKLS